MLHLLKTNVGRLHILGFLEGTTLLILVFIAVPMKYYFGNPGLSEYLGPIHGAVFILFVVNAISVGIDHKWKIITGLKVFVACFIPFGTFYIDKKILSRL